MDPSNWMRRRDAQLRDPYGESTQQTRYESYNTSFFGLPSTETHEEEPNSSTISLDQSTNFVDPKYAYLYKSFKPNKKTKFTAHRNAMMQKEKVASGYYEEEFQNERPSFEGAPPALSDAVKGLIESRKKRFAKMMRQTDDYDGVDSAHSSDMEIDGYNESSSLSNKRTAIMEREVLPLLDSTYETVIKTTNITSEERINKLITSIKATLSANDVEPFEFQQYVEKYVSRMIMEKKWTSLTVSTAIFLTVASPVKVELEQSPDAWFKCLMCSYAYPPGKFACCMCGQKFKSKPDLFVHEFELHGRLFDEHTVCEICRMVFHKNPLGLKTHYKVNHVCQFEHLECMFGCKTLVLGTHSRALAEHVYSFHACIECNDLLSSSLDKHLELFHTSKPSSSSDSLPKETSQKDDFSLGRQEEQFRDASSHSSLLSSKRHRSPSEDRSNKRMAREKGTTFEEAKSFIDKLFDDNTVPEESSDSIYEPHAASKHTSKMSNKTQEKKPINQLSLKDEINMMFSKSNKDRPSHVQASLPKPRQTSPPLFDIATYDPKLRERKFHEETGPTSRHVVELCEREESPPNELVMLEDEKSSITHVRGSEGNRTLKRSNLYAEELLPRGVISATLPVYRDGLYYRGSPSRESSPTLKSSHSNSRYSTRDASAKNRSRSISNEKEKSSLNGKTSPNKPSKRRRSDSEDKKRTASSEFKNKLDEVEKLLTTKVTKCKLCHFSCPANGGYSCRVCKKQFLMETKLAMHMSTDHKIKIPIDLKCSFCDTETCDVKTLHNHLCDKHLCRETHVQCPFGCELLFTKDNYEVHLEGKHNRKYCDACEKDFAISLKSHKCKPKKKPGIDKESLEKLMGDADGVFSDDELMIVEMKKESSGSIEEYKVVKHEIVTISLAPKAGSAKISVQKNRSCFQSCDVTRAMIHSRDITMYKSKGLFYCKKCPLVYNPTLKSCSRCDLLFFDAKDLALHAIDAHGCSMNSTDIGCDYCCRVFNTYEEVLNHRSTHFCKEHMECTEGCKELIVGRCQQKKLHLSKYHAAQDAPIDSNIFMGNVSSDGDSTSNVLGISGLIKCSDCILSIPPTFEIVCDKCSVDNQLTFYSQDELTYHQEKQHRISCKGNFVCNLCKDPQSFKNDLSALLNHRYKKHKICKSHVKCPRKDCSTIVPRGKLESHLRKECDFVDSADVTLRPWFTFDHYEVKICSKCDFGIQTLKLFKCPDCSAVCADKYEFYAHMKLDHKRDEFTNDLQFVCARCPGTASFSVSRWRQHRVDKHGYCSSHFVCLNMSCNLLVESLSALKKHVQNNSECRNHPTVCPSEFLGPKTCVSCGQVKSETVERHCMLCAQMSKNPIPFTDNTEYSMHLTYRHNKAIQTEITIRCDICKSSFTNFAELGNHRMRSHKCCNKHSLCRFNRKCKSVFHFKDTWKAHTCKEDPTFKNRNESEKMSKSVSKVDLKPSERHLLKCADCSYVTNSRPDVFTCRLEHCYKHFVTQLELSAHHVIKHKVAVSGLFQCFLCSSNPSFVDAPDKLLEHNNKTHSFCKQHKQCPTPGCNWIFNSSYNISKHLRKCIGVSTLAEDLGIKSEKERIESSHKSKSNSKETKSTKTESPKKKSSEKKGGGTTQEVPPRNISSRDSFPEEGEVNESPVISLDTFTFTRKSKDVALESGSSLLSCVECSRKFWVDKVIECMVCDSKVPLWKKQFLSKLDLMIHLETTHKDSNATPHTCTICNEKFPNSSQVFNHNSKVHNCCGCHFACLIDECNKAFGNEQNFLAHQAKEHCVENSRSGIVEINKPVAGDTSLDFGAYDKCIVDEMEEPLDPLEDMENYFELEPTMIDDPSIEDADKNEKESNETEVRNEINSGTTDILESKETSDVANSNRNKLFDESTVAVYPKQLLLGDGINGENQKGTDDHQSKTYEDGDKLRDDSQSGDPCKAELNLSCTGANIDTAQNSRQSGDFLSLHDDDEL